MCGYAHGMGPYEVYGENLAMKCLCFSSVQNPDVSFDITES